MRILRIKKAKRVTRKAEGGEEQGALVLRYTQLKLMQSDTTVLL